MLKQIRLQNFQCHNRTKVELGQVTSVIGPSDVGKSSVIRALKWVVTNSPRGNDFIQDGAKGCTAIIDIDEHSIRRKKGEGTNEYILDKGGPFKSFGTGVPDPIKKVLNISDLNFQGQHDPPFWFCETPGQVSRNLNAIVDLELIDGCLANVNRRIAKAKTEKEITHKRLQQARDKKRSLEWVEEANTNFEKVEELKKKKDEQVVRCESLEVLIQLIKSHKRNGKLWRQASVDGKLVLEAAALCRQEEEQIDNLSSLIEEIQRLEQIKKPDFSKVEEAKDKVKAAKTEYNTLQFLVEATKEHKRRLTADGMKYQKMKRELEEKTEGLCPLCGNQMKS